MQCLVGRGKAVVSYPKYYEKPLGDFDLEGGMW